MNLVIICFRDNWTLRAAMKISSVLLKYPTLLPTFEGSFFILSWTKKNQNLSFCILQSVHQKVANHKSDNVVEYTFLRSK